MSEPRDFLEGTSWRLARLAGDDIEAEAPNAVEFRDGQVVGRVGVNRFTGQYSVVDGRLVVGPAVATTMMAGPPHLMELESRFQRALPGEHAIEIQGLRLGDREFAPASPPPVVAIKGIAMYRERMMPPPGSRFVVELHDVSRADPTSEVMATQTSEIAGGPPYEFELSPQAPLDDSHSYSVRARIVGPDGTLMWTTPDHVAPSGARLELLMVRA